MSKELIGRKIADVRPMTLKEMDGCGIEQGEECIGIVLDNGTILLAMRDEEGNGPGALNYLQKGECFVIY